MSGLPPVHAGCIMADDTFMRIYRYVNVSLDFDDYIYVKDNQISYHSRIAVTPYHGSFVHEGDRVLLRFHWRGVVAKMKTAVLLPGGYDSHLRRQYRGHDNTGSIIELAFRGRYQWCNRCRGWHMVCEESESSAPSVWPLEMQAITLS